MEFCVLQFINPWFSAPSFCTASFREQQHSLTVYTWFSLPTVLPYSIVMPVTGPCFQTAADNTLAFLISIVMHFIPSWELSNKKKKNQKTPLYNNFGGKRTWQLQEHNSEVVSPLQGPFTVVLFIVMFRWVSGESREF